MIRIFNRPLLSLICVVILVAGFVSCKKDNNVNSGKVELLSFGPTGAKPGDTLRFIGNNLNQVTSIDLTGATVPSSSFLQTTPELILIVIPQQTQQGFVTLRTPQGDIVSKTKLNLMVPLKIRTLTKEARPGENVTITGEFLTWVNRVTFSKNKVVDSTGIVSKSLTQLVVKVPLDAQTGPIVLSYGGTEPKDVESADTLKVTLPVVTGFSPNPVKHGTNLTITGTNLDLASKVLFTGVSTAVVTFVSQSATQLVVQVPAAATKGKVTLEAASGVRLASTLDLDVALPAITTMAPNPVAPEANLTITGTNLDLVSSVAFTGIPAAVSTFVSQSATELVVKVPAGTLRGKVTLNVKNSSLTVQSSADLQIVGSSVAPIIVYDNALSSNWEKWGGWGTTVQELESTEQAQSGAKAIKITYSDAYGAIQLHPKTTFAFPPPGYTKLKVSIYGGTGATATSRVAIYMKDATDPTDAQSKILTLVPGVFTTYEIPLSDFSNNPAKVNEFVIKNYGTANITIYVDDILFQ